VKAKKNRSANVLIAHELNNGNENLLALLADNNFHVTPCQTADSLLEEARQGHPDLALLDIQSTTFDAIEIAKTLAERPETSDMAAVLFNVDNLPETFERAISAGVDDIILGKTPGEELMGRLRPLLRLATMRREVTHRVELAREYGAPPTDGLSETDNAPFNLLHVGADSNVIASIKDAFERTGKNCRITSTPNVDTADAILGGDFFDSCFVMLDDDDISFIDALGFCSRTRLNPRLFNLPVLLVPSSTHLLDTAEALSAGATQVIELSDDATSLSSSLVLLSTRQRSRWQISRLLNATKSPDTTDSRTGAYTFDFMKSRLTSLLEAARIREKHLTLVFFSFPDAHTVAEQYGQTAGEHLLRQLAGWINAMLRTEDMIAHYTGHDFCIALPDTPVDEALFVMNRISGVLTYTDFALDEVYQPISISVEFGLADNEPGDTTETLIKRARQYLD
jgi:two-component system, cell cycle response regulator